MKILNHPAKAQHVKRPRPATADASTLKYGPMENFYRAGQEESVQAMSPALPLPRGGVSGILMETLPRDQAEQVWRDVREQEG